LQQKPGDSWLVIAQAQVYMQIGDFPRALGLLDDALASATTATDRRSALYYRGHANFNLGQYTQAADDFDASLAGRTPKSRLSPLLWRYAAQVRTRRDARGALAKDVGNETLDEWPGPIVRFLLGKLPAGELEVVAESDDAAKRSKRQMPVRLLHRHGRHTARRQAARARPAPARPGALPDGVRAQLGRRRAS